MDDRTRAGTHSSSKAGFGLLVAAVIVVLVLLYALFAGGTGSTTLDPASFSTTDDSAPAIQETTPAAPTAPAVGE